MVDGKRQDEQRTENALLMLLINPAARVSIMGVFQLFQPLIMSMSILLTDRIFLLAFVLSRQARVSTPIDI